MSDDKISIPIIKANSLKTVSAYILEKECKIKEPDEDQISSYEKQLKAKGYEDVSDLRIKDPRWWTSLQQYLTQKIIIYEQDLPPCPVEEESAPVETITDKPKKEEPSPAEIPEDKPEKIEKKPPKKTVKPPAEKKPPKKEKKEGKFFPL